MRIIRRPFEWLATQCSNNLGHPLSFIIALLTILAWACLGPMFQYSDTWQLIVNTGTTITTFLMVFLLQNAQNRNSEETNDLIRELHDKIDQLSNERNRDN